MTHKEIIYQAICEICNTDNPQRFAKMNKTVFEVAKKALELFQPSLPSNLDEVAKETAEGLYLDRHNLIWMFKAGAEWMAGQEVI